MQSKCRSVGSRNNHAPSMVQDHMFYNSLYGRSHGIGLDLTGLNCFVWTVCLQKKGENTIKQRGSRFSLNDY